MKAAFLVDTNVLVYAYDPSDQVKRQRATDVLKSLWDTNAGALSAQVLGEFYVTVIRGIPSPLTPRDAEQSITRYMRSWEVYPVTAWAVREAVQATQRHSMQFWDALIWATAKFNQVPTILTEDFTDGRTVEGVRYINPFAPAFSMALLKQ